MNRKKVYFFENEIKKIKNFYIYILVGIPGSGKSEFVLHGFEKPNSKINNAIISPKSIKFHNDNLYIISRDDDRNSTRNTEDKDSKFVGNKEEEDELTTVTNKKVKNIIDKFINDETEDSITLVFDNTNLRKSYRENIINNLRDCFSNYNKDELNVNVVFVNVDHQDPEADKQKKDPYYVIRRLGKMTEDVVDENGNKKTVSLNAKQIKDYYKKKKDQKKNPKEEEANELKKVCNLTSVVLTMSGKKLVDLGNASKN